MKEEKARSLIQLSVDTSKNVLRAFCQKRLMQCSHEQDFNNFLDKNLHYPFHQFEGENIRCCECSASVCDIAKENVIPQLEFCKYTRAVATRLMVIQNRMEKKLSRSVCIHTKHGDLSKIEIQWLNVIRRSVQRLNEALLKPILPLQLNWEDLKEAVVSLTCPHYYRPMVKALFEIIREEEKEEIKRTVPATTIEQEQPSSCNKDVDAKDPKRTENTTLQDELISKSSVPSIRNKTALTDYKSNKFHVETCKTVNVIRNFTLNVQHQKMVANADRQISSSSEQSELDVMWHFETPSNWKIGRIIRKLKNKSYEISSDMLIRIKRINKGSLNILPSVDFNVLSNREAWESVCGVFLEKIVESFVVQSSRTRTYEIDVRVEIVHPGWWNFDYNLADLTTQFKMMLHLHRQIQEYENNEIPYQDFNEDTIDNIAMIRQGMTLPFRINDGMVCRFILAHVNEFDNNDMKDLYSALQEAVESQASNNAKIIA
ncbi:unnamed protein product [Mytilus coruscus]|uniref:Uncharacterized protein n=1 Tax=Mytilus coruscus TaxID=42192 RepID=A0A6J8ATM0_MYTCO|nr:unnamed protein product [Mytilus coruscus]